MPKLNELHEKYGRQGLVIIAVHSDPDHEKGKQVAAQEGMKFPVAFDDSKLMQKLGCDSFPDYAIIDKKGNFRAVDLANAEIEKAAVALLSERN